MRWIILSSFVSLQAHWTWNYHSVRPISTVVLNWTMIDNFHNVEEMWWHHTELIKREINIMCQASIRSQRYIKRKTLREPFSDGLKQSCPSVPDLRRSLYLLWENLKNVTLDDTNLYWQISSRRCYSLVTFYFKQNLHFKSNVYNKRFIQSIPAEKNTVILLTLNLPLIFL